MKAKIQDFTGLLINRLWDQYLKRVSYAELYSGLIDRMGGRIIHDHIAFRTLNIHTGEQPEGISAISHIIKILGYNKAGVYKIPRMRISACHFEHPDPLFPKIFVSELEVNEFPEWFSELVHELVVETPYLLSDQGIELLNLLKQEGELPVEAAEILLGELAGYFSRPWDIISKESLLKINDVSQYAAWTLLFGNSVSHFAASVNHQNVPEWADIESTFTGLKIAGVPMKDGIEGERGSKLRQAATLPVKEEVQVLDEEGDMEEMDWPYSYLELTERGFEGEGIEKKLFTGFLGEQTVPMLNLTRNRDI